MEELLTVAEVAAALKVSSDTVTRLFEDLPGVIVFGRPKETRSKRRYRTLRIPRSVLVGFVNKHQN